MVERRTKRGQHFTAKAYITALVTLTLGVLLSLETQDWTWFSRSGSLVVINGIILTSHQIIEHMRTLGQGMREGESQFQRDWATESKRHFIHDDYWRTWMNEKYGLYMLIVGTLVWGFGDLINTL